MGATERRPTSAPVVRLLRQLPFTALFTLAVAGVALAKRYLVADGLTLERQASTNLENLSRRPLRALAASAVVVEGSAWLLPAAGTAALLGGVEDLSGTRRAIGVAATGHVAATLLTQAAVWTGIRTGRLPKSARMQIDIGTSYIAAAAAGALIPALPRRSRIVCSALAAGAAIADVAISRHVLATGHGIALTAGYLLGARSIRIASL